MTTEEIPTPLGVHPSISDDCPAVVGVLRCHSVIVVVQPTEDWDRSKFGRCSGWRLWPVGDRSIAPEPLMRPVAVIVLIEELLDKAVQMPVVDRNGVIEQLST